jgi:large subunit ribosomal protein L10e
MALRPGRAYRRIHRPYTRQSQKKPRKGYIKGVPKPKITEFELGTKGEYEHKLVLLSKNAVQIRHNALESARIAAVQTLEKNLGKGATYFLKVRIYPHHVLRENALATGAGADRFQQGMRQSFGKPIGTAAQVRVGQPLMEVRTNNADVGKMALKKASHKLPTPCRIVVE